MDSESLSNREAEEHIKLLRRASRARLVRLGLWAVATWGLWLTLEGGDQKAAAVRETYEKRLVDLREKWDVPSNMIVVYSMECFEIFKELSDLKLPADNSKILGFCKELDPLRGEYYSALEPSYIVQAKMPYLQEPVIINGLTLADWWPFGLMAIVASAIVLSMRERVNAVVVAWISYNRKNNLVTQDLIIHSDFLVGTLTEERTFNRQFLIYRKPLMIQPESLLVYALIGATMYLSFSLGVLDNPANSYEMESTLLDYVALIWFSLAALSALVWFTRKRYAETLEQYVGMPVRGRISQRLHRVAANLKGTFGNVLERHQWLRKVSEGLFAVAALACLYLPWMDPQRMRGYRFFLPTAPDSLSDDLYFELQVQLFFATLFVVLSLIDWFVTTVLSRPKFGLLSKVRRFLGIGTVVLLGNLVFHILMLQMLAMEEGWLLPWNSLARPHPIKNSLLIWTEPAYGFWLFLTLCLILVMVGKRPPEQATTSVSPSPG